MCRVIAYTNPHCCCKWLQVHRQCQPNSGFSHCPTFGKHRVAPYPKERESLTCPSHELRGDYDRNYVRMIRKEKNIMKVGFGPRPNGPGFDIRCMCTVM